MNGYLKLAIAGALLLSACATPEPQALAPSAEPEADFSQPSQTVWPELSRFSSEAEFKHYYLTVSNQLEGDEADATDAWYEDEANGEMAMPPPAPPPPPPPPPAESSAAQPSPAAPAQEMTVTGAKASDENPSITNTQEAGVDEGDIVKQIGQYLVIMQDGRLFSVDLKPDGQPGLRFVDRENVYRTTEEDTWYDEVLVFGRQMIVIGYSYDAEASIFAVLDLSEDGEITFRDRFFLPAMDYYSGDNYTTRLVNGQLALHTSYYLTDFDDFEDLKAPALSRTMAEGDTPHLNGTDVYRPMQDVSDPLLHTITLCPLKGLDESESAAPDCHTTAFLAGDDYEYYASQDAVWLWVNADGRYWWTEDEGTSKEKATLLYSIPYADKAPGVARVQGSPVNQFSLAAGDDVFRAFVEVDIEETDEAGQEKSPYRLLQLPRDAIGKSPPPVDPSDYVMLPDVGDGPIENRFTNTHFVYTTQNGSVTFWGEEDQDDVSAELAFVELANPQDITLLSIDHGVIRLERARDHIVATGYRDRRGLSLTSLDLRGDTPRLAGQVTLISRYESENRSHAFNSRIGEDGDGIIGLPTVLQQWEAGRWVWRSESSDLSFLNVNKDASLGSLGTLRGASGEPDPSYECEVSCIDWYGNSRPIFTMGRIFALSGTSVVEGAIEEGRGVSEIRRVDLTAAPGGASQPAQ